MSDLAADIVADPPLAPVGEGVPFPVVGVGASAGGLEAFTELLEALPAKPGLALVLVTHLDPARESLLAEILNRCCRMGVSEVEQGTAIEVDHVYVIPPGATMEMEAGHLRLTPRPPKPVPHMPIDHLFRSLATIQRGRAVGVILSGNGTDGAIAFQAIKAAGGVTFAQDERSAQYPSMPRAAFLDGNVDHVLPPAQIAHALEVLARHPYTHEPHLNGATPAPAAPRAPDPLGDILELVRARAGVDFTHYRRTTIDRRVSRRMALRNLRDPRDYLKVLQGDAGEVQLLFQDFLIRVTQFFRDPEAFEALKGRAFPKMVAGHTRGTPLRLWVAGCATGEEVYSLAISLLEFLDGRPEHVAVKILATDLNEANLEKARAGVYLDNIEIDVSAERLSRFFTRHDHSYQISKAVRELCVFSRHDMTADPPFSRLDLVSCRNVLIYMESALQKRVIPLLHYSLRPEGFLLLGSAENVGAHAGLFEAVDGRNRLFARTGAGHALPTDFKPFALGVPARPPGPAEPPLWSALDVQREADRVMLARYVGVVVDETMTVLQFRGRTAPYLEPAPGTARLDLLRMLREGLLPAVRSAILQARTENAVATRGRLRVAEGDGGRQVRVEVVPLRVPPSGVRFFLVLFQDADATPPPPDIPPAAGAGEHKFTQLQGEIAALREHLQSVQEQQESANEELRAANEEILSANEELQSTNEELQTAKEESQSTNEELVTVNDELRHRIVELARLNNDLVNLLAGVNIPIVMLGRDLRIRRFTPLAERSFNLIPTDVGRPLTDIKSNLEVPDLAALIHGVIDTVTPYEGEVRDADGHWHSLRIRPYVTTDNKIDGASIVLLDVDAIRGKGEPLLTG